MKLGFSARGGAAAQSVSRRRRWRQLAERDTLAAHHGQQGTSGLGHAPAGRAGKRRALSDAGGGASCAPGKRGAGTLRCASGGGRKVQKNKNVGRVLPLHQSFHDLGARMDHARGSRLRPSCPLCAAGKRLPTRVRDPRASLA